MCCFHLNSLKAARKYSNLHRFTCNCKAKAPKLWSNQSFCGKVKGRIKTICFVVKLKAIQKIVQYSLYPQSPKVPNQPDLSCKTLRKLQQMAFLDTRLHFIDLCWNSGPTGEIFAKQLNPNHPLLPTSLSSLNKTFVINYCRKIRQKSLRFNFRLNSKRVREIS